MQRARERSAAFIAAITGSVGKTSTKDMTRLMLSRFGDTHASAASYNNHWGVPLTLARMPAESRFGVFELGMNHAGEIAALVAQVRPHVAVVTRIAPVHLEYFGSIEKIADAKAEIFSALDGGVAIINRDDGFYERLAAAAAPTASHVFGFGETEGAHARLLSYEPAGEGALVEAEILERRLRFRIGAPGKHIAINALAALLVGAVFDVDLEEAAAVFADFRRRPDGAGARKYRRQAATLRSSTKATTPTRPPCARRWSCLAARRQDRAAVGSRFLATCWSSGPRPPNCTPSSPRTLSTPRSICYSRRGR